MRLLRLSKRRQIRTMLVAAWDLLEANKDWIQFPLRAGKMRLAHQPGWCTVCGLPIQVNDPIDLGIWPDNTREWMHVEHPNRWQALRDNLEPADDVIITWAGTGQGPLQDRLSIRIRRPQSRFEGHHSDYLAYDEAKERGIL